ncbi:MAG: hypothetical protein ACT4P0_09150 [Panacagrimonas sp.]
MNALSLATTAAWILYSLQLNDLKLNPLPSWLELVTAIGLGFSIAVHMLVLPQIVASNEYADNPRFRLWSHRLDRIADAVTATVVVLFVLAGTGSLTTIPLMLAKLTNNPDIKIPEPLLWCALTAASGVIANRADYLFVRLFKRHKKSLPNGSEGQ